LLEFVLNKNVPAGLMLNVIFILRNFEFWISKSRESQYFRNIQN